VHPDENKQSLSTCELHLHLSIFMMQLNKFLLAFLLLASHYSFGQFVKGSHMIGASVASGLLSSGTTKYTYPTAAGYTTDNTNFNISITPSYGKFLNRSAVGGISLLIHSSYQKQNNKSVSDTIFSSSKNSNTDLGLGVFLRYYFSTDKNMRPFMHVYLSGGTGFGNSSGYSYGADVFGAYKETYNGKSSGRVFMNAGLNVGFSKMLTGQIGLDVFAGYLFSYSKYETETNSVIHYTSTGGNDVIQKFQATQKFTGNGLTLGAGIQVFLGK
jgi:hypothetical protein